MEDELVSLIYQLNEQCNGCEKFYDFCINCELGEKVANMVDVFINYCEECELPNEGHCNSCGATSFSPCPINAAVNSFKLPNDFRVCNIIDCKNFKCSANLF